MHTGQSRQSYTASHPLAILPVGEFSGGADETSTPTERSVDQSPNLENTSRDHDGVRQLVGDAERRGVDESGDSSQSDALLEIRQGAAVGSHRNHGPQLKPDVPARKGEWALASLPAGSFGMNLAHGTVVPAVVPAVPFRFLPPNQVCWLL